MEGDLSTRNPMQASGSYGGFDLGPMRVQVHHHQQQTLPPPPPPPHHHLRQGSTILHQSNFPLSMGGNQEDRSFSLTDYNRGKSGSDEDEPSLTEDAADNNPSKGKKSSPWQRVKWTDNMVKLLITAVSYISEEAGAEYVGGGVVGERRKYTNLQKKGKWKSVSKVMAERGHFVSPQQCEDKFNDLNKRYKRLNEILGRGTSCEVVENPTLLDVMDHVSEKGKEEVRKILSSKHLHYEEMCSYHNGNRLHLPPDPDLQRSLRLALRSRNDQDDPEVRRDDNEVDEEGEFDEHGVYEGNSVKRAKQCSNSNNNHEEFSFKNNSLDCNRGFNFQVENVEKQTVNGNWNVQIEERRINLEMQMLELEKERFKWQRFCRKKDRELETMKMEIERMKLENERMALDLRQKELNINNN